VSPAVARRGADLVVDALAAAGVTHLFSLSGNQILSVYDATVGRGPAIVHTRHEAAAVHMADAWGRLTERPGVALVTAGPGHLNALSALYGARMAESPVVLLSGASPLAQAGRGAFQEVDQVAAARPVTKAAWLATDAERLGEDVARALELARSGRPGAVHVSLPGDLLEAHVGAPAPARAPAAPEPELDPVLLDQALALLAGAERPLILLGPAMARPKRRAAVESFARLTGSAALPMESPRGTNDPWLHGAAPLLGEADVVLLLGKKPDFAVKFGEPPAFAPGARLIQVDADRDALRAARRIAVAIHGAPERVIERLHAAAEGRPWRHAGWFDEVARARRTLPVGWEALRHSSRQPIHPLRVCAAVQPFLDRGAILVADGGEFGQWAQAGLEAETRLINGPSGSIGSALPMALAARLAEPGRQVLALLGDGTFGFHPAEFDTALRYGLPIVAVVGNDARWNAEHQLQLRHYGAERLVGCELLPTRYDRVVEALGGHGELVERAEALEGALARAAAAGLPACVNVLIDGVAAPTYAAAPGH
jgi:acetolactate synthase-1/2/3 large subunit